MWLKEIYIKLGAFVLDIFMSKRVFCENIYERNYSKNALVCYLTHPFYRKLVPGHTNGFESVEMTKVLDKLHFNVDVCRYDSQLLMNTIPYKGYCLIIGIEPGFVKLVKRFNPNKAIYYATGSYFEFQNNEEMKRIKGVEERTKKVLSQKRFVKPHESLKYADGVILIGNDHTKRTYLGKAKKIETINVTAFAHFPYKIIEHSKHWNNANKNFLWFGSFGAVHKGLDLLLDVFKKRKDLNLYICGSLIKEPDFIKAYKNELSDFSNIVNCGFVDPSGPIYKKLVSTCAFVILPSCSEGMSGSVATCMYSGLIPIVSKESGINISRYYGFILEKNSISEIDEILSLCSNLTEKKIKLMSKNAYLYAKREFLLSTYRRNLLRAINKLI